MWYIFRKGLQKEYLYIPLLVLSISLINIITGNGSSFSIPRYIISILLVSIVFRAFINYKLYRYQTSYQHSLQLWIYLITLYYIFAFAIFQNSFIKVSLDYFKLVTWSITSLFFFRLGQSRFSIYANTWLRIICKITFIIIAIRCIYLLTFGVTSNNEGNDLYRELYNVNSYLLLLITPFLFLKKDKYNIIYLLFYIIILICIQKRGPIISSIGGLLFVFFFDNKIKFKKKIIYILAVLAILIILIVILNFTNPIILDSLIQRFIPHETQFHDSQTVIMSSRNILWESIWEKYSEGTVSNWIFGFGFFQVPELFRKQLDANNMFAHSDWMEILYDYGIIGIIIFIYLNISMIKIILRYNNSRYNKKYRIILLYSYGIFFTSTFFTISTMSMTSTVWFFMPYSFLAGMSYPINRHKKRIKKTLL